jgi:hypothetical protein
MANNTASSDLYNLLITRDFDVQALDAKTGKPPIDAEGHTDMGEADMFSFDYVASSGKNYGTVVILTGEDGNFNVFFGDNIGKTMDQEDKDDWFQFLQQLSQFAKRNRMRLDLSNISKLKYTMQGISALKESYYGNRKISYSGQPMEARLMIKHNRTLGEEDARFRHIESLFIETADEERYKLPFRSLVGGRAMLEHVRSGGKPYDDRGQHITQVIEQLAVLSHFRRANQGKVFEGAAGDLVQETLNYYESLKKNIKALGSSRGYKSYFESWAPEEVNEQELLVDDIKGLFIEQKIDPRIEAALPTMARIQQGHSMKEAKIFEEWIDNVAEGTWELPDTPEQLTKLKALVGQELIVGSDGINATEQLYDIVGDDHLFDLIGALAKKDPNANAWDSPEVVQRLQQLVPGIEIGAQTPEPNSGLGEDDKQEQDECWTTTATPPLEESDTMELDKIKFLAFPK